MRKQYENTLLEPEVKRRLLALRDELGLPSVSATVTFLIDSLPESKRKPVSSVSENEEINYR